MEVAVASDEAREMPRVSRNFCSLPCAPRCDGSGRCGALHRELTGDAARGEALGRGDVDAHEARATGDDRRVALFDTGSLGDDGHLHALEDRDLRDADLGRRGLRGRREPAVVARASAAHRVTVRIHLDDFGRTRGEEKGGESEAGELHGCVSVVPGDPDAIWGRVVTVFSRSAHSMTKVELYNRTVTRRICWWFLDPPVVPLTRTHCSANEP